MASWCGCQKDEPRIMAADRQAIVILLTPGACRHIPPSGVAATAFKLRPFGPSVVTHQFRAALTYRLFRTRRRTNG